MGTLQNVGFKTSIFTGVTPREGAGQALARLVAGTIDATNKGLTYARKQQAFEAREKAIETKEQEDESYLVYLSEKNKFAKNYHEQGVADKPSDEQQTWVDDNYNSEAFANPDGKYGLMYDSEMNKYFGHIAKTLTKEHERTADAMVTREVSHLNLSDYTEGIDGLHKLHGGASVLKKSMKFDYVLSNAISHTNINMKRDFDSGKLYGMTKKEIINEYGGKAFGEIENKSSKEYLDFEASVDKISGKLIEQKNKDNVSKNVQNGTDATAVVLSASNANMDIKEVTKLVSGVVTKNLINGNIDEAINISNQYRSNGVKIDVLDKKVENLFAGGIPDISSIDLYAKTKDDYPYAPELNKQMSMLSAVAFSKNLDLTNEEHLKSALEIMKVNEYKPLHKDVKKDLHTEINSGIMDFFDYSSSERIFLEERATLYIKMGLEEGSAIDMAEKEYKKYDQYGDEPYGMFAVNQKEADDMAKAFSETNSVSDSTLAYTGNDKWSYRDGEAEANITTAQLKKKTLALNKMNTMKEKLFESLSETKVSGDDKEIKKEIRKRAEAQVLTDNPDIKGKEKDRIVDIMIIEGIDLIEEEKDRLAVKKFTSLKGTNVGKTVAPISKAIDKVIEDASVLPSVFKLGINGLKMQLEKTVKGFDKLSENIKDSLASEKYKKAIRNRK